MTVAPTAVTWHTDVPCAVWRVAIRRYTLVCLHEDVWHNLITNPIEQLYLFKAVDQYLSFCGSVLKDINEKNKYADPTVIDSSLWMHPSTTSNAQEWHCAARKQSLCTKHKLGGEIFTQIFYSVDPRECRHNYSDWISTQGRGGLLTLDSR